MLNTVLDVIEVEENKTEKEIMRVGGFDLIYSTTRYKINEHCKVKSFLGCQIPETKIEESVEDKYKQTEVKPKKPEKPTKTAWK